MARQRGSTWQADVVLRGGNKRLRPGGFQTQASAELWEAQARANDEQGLHPPPVPAPKPTVGINGGITLGDLRKLVLTTPKKKGGGGGWLNSKDYKNAEARSQMACDFFGEDTVASSIDLNEMERYARACRTAGNRGSTINRKMANVSKMLTFAERRGLITAAPTAPQEEEPEGRIRFLTADEEAAGLAMLEIMGCHDFRQLAIFLLDTGCRISEALAMGPQDYSVGVQPCATFWVTKGGKSRTVPLTPRAVAAIGYFQKQGAGNNGGPFEHIPYWEFRYTWERARKRLGPQYADAVIHVFRHTCCSRLVQGGMDLRRVQVWMGHKDIKTTLKYAHLAPGDLNAGLALLQQAVMPQRSFSAEEQRVDNVTALVPKRATA